MTSLADELDPAFHDLSLSNGRDDHYAADEEGERYDYAYGQSVSSTSSTPIRPSAKRSGHRRRGRGSSDASSSNGAIVHHADGFSLADELGGGAVEEGSRDAANQGVTLSDEFEQPPPSLDVDFLQGPDRKADPDLNGEARARRDQEHYLVSSEALEESTRQTDRFLRMLHNTIDTSVSTAQSTNQHSHIASSASMTSLANGQDDTAGVEQAAAGIVRQLREQAQLREGQVRELQECDRIIRRAFEEGGEYLMALAETNELDERGDEDLPDRRDRDPLGLSSLTSDLNDKTIDERLDSTLAGADVTYDVSSFKASDEATNSYTASMKRSADHDATSPSTMQNLIKLQQSTSDLVFSLGAIHEHNQIAHATLGEATRKLRNVRTVLTNWQDEVRLVDKSCAWIAAHEDSLKTKSDRPADVRKWMQDEMEQFEFALEEAHIKARQLLMPIRDPVLDRLAASATTA